MPLRCLFLPTKGGTWQHDSLCTACTQLDLRKRALYLEKTLILIMAAMTWRCNQRASAARAWHRGYVALQ